MKLETDKKYFLAYVMPIDWKTLPRDYFITTYGREACEHVFMNTKSNDKSVLKRVDSLLNELKNRSGSGGIIAMWEEKGMPYGRFWSTSIQLGANYTLKRALREMKKLENPAMKLPHDQTYFKSYHKEILNGTFE